jgi:hypothetical protein
MKVGAGTALANEVSLCDANDDRCITKKLNTVEIRPVKIMNTLKLLGIAGALTIGIAGCDVDVEDEGKLPEVDVEEGRMPDVDVEAPEVDVDTENVEVPVPDVDINPAEENEQ